MITLRQYDETGQSGVVTPVIRKAVLIAVIFMFCLLILTVSAFALTEDELPGGSFSGLRWNLDTSSGTLFISRTEENTPQGVSLCIAAVYSENGQMQQLCTFEIPSDSQQLELSFSKTLTDTFLLRFFFLDESLIPVVTNSDWEITVVEPGCVSKGYTVVSDGENSFFYCVVPALGHHWGEWETIDEPCGVEPGLQSRDCTVCGTKDNEPLYPETDLPILRLYGNIENIEKRVDVPVTSRFCGAGISFENYANLKYQGHSSLVYPKKNFTIKFYKDIARTQADKYQFYNWNKEAKYILRANYVDPSKARNLICADLWFDVCKCREGTKHIKKLFHYGATDGMPTGVYLNDQYIGLYDLTLHKDDDLYDLDKGQEDALMIINHSTMDESLFRAPAIFADDSDWELEFCGTEDQTWPKEKLNALIDFVINSSDEEFSDKKVLKQHLNIDSAIDYLLSMYAFGLTNSYAKNLVLLSYSQDPWIFSMFDMEDAFGLSIDGSTQLSPEYALPSYTDSVWDSGTGSLLWDRMLQCYSERIAARYTELRQSVFTEEYILDTAKARLDKIPEDFFLADRALYPEMPDLDTNTLNQISEYLSARFELLDKLFLTTEQN